MIYRQSVWNGLKAKLKLWIDLGPVGAVAFLSLFIAAIGIPYLANATATTTNTCFASSELGLTYMPTLWTLIPLSAAFVAGLGFYKEKKVLVWPSIACFFSSSILLSLLEKKPTPTGRM
jgi:hypothetical protein